MIPGRWNPTGKKLFMAVIVIVGFILILNSGTQKENLNPSMAFDNLDLIIDSSEEYSLIEDEHRSIVNEFYERRKDIPLTALGRVLFMNEKRPPKRDKVYKILMYKIGKSWEGRHLYYFGKVRHEPFENCDVSNCVLSYNDTDFDNADAVVFHLHTFDKDYNTPTDVPRPPWQRWIFITDECPEYTFMKQPNHWFNYSGVFNWSMTYRLESDVPVPFGRIVPLEEPLILDPSLSFEEKFNVLVPHAEVKRRDVLVAILSSNCYANNRIQYVQELQKYMAVDVYGGCGTEELKKICPWMGYGHECQELKKYLFYLSFDNANCVGYVSEKTFSHAYKLGSIPIFMGIFRNQSDSVIPPDSYIHIDDFKNPEELAKHILHINATLEENYLKYHEWRKHFKSLSEDGYMGSKSYHYCRLCEALNYNDEKPKIYHKELLATILDPGLNCHPPRW